MTRAIGAASVPKFVVFGRFQPVSVLVDRIGGFDFSKRSLVKRSQPVSSRFGSIRKIRVKNPTNSRPHLTSVNSEHGNIGLHNPVTQGRECLKTSEKPPTSSSS